MSSPIVFVLVRIQLFLGDCPWSPSRNTFVSWDVFLGDCPWTPSRNTFVSLLDRWLSAVKARFRFLEQLDSIGGVRGASRHVVFFWSRFDSIHSNLLWRFTISYQKIIPRYLPREMQGSYSSRRHRIGVCQSRHGILFTRSSCLLKFLGRHPRRTARRHWKLCFYSQTVSAGKPLTSETFGAGKLLEQMGRDPALSVAMLALVVFAEVLTALEGQE